jgi:hypothetical protein
MAASIWNTRMPLGRRTLLQAGGLSALGLGLPQLFESGSEARAEGRSPGSARSCIMLYMLGGPPQQETFDVKPQAPDTARSLFAPISTTVPGIEICELLPRLAQQAHRFAILRSTYHGGNALFHGAGTHFNLTGWPNVPREGEPFLDRRDSPSIGAVLNQLVGDVNGLPAAIQLPIWITQDGPGREWAGQHAGFLGRKFDPLVMVYGWLRQGVFEAIDSLPGTLPTAYARREDVAPARLDRRLQLLRLMDTRPADLESGAAKEWNTFQSQAADVLTSGTAWQAFSIENETPAVRERYGDDQFGRSCLAARRLVEAGVRLVTVIFGGWDTHTHHLEHTRDRLLPPMDRAFAALLDDLDERGLLGETLVAWTGEFGRTPSMNVNSPPGRDHWARVYSTVLAGGGVRGGQVYGGSDNLAAEPKDHPVHVGDFVATIYHALGYGHDTQVIDMFGRPHYIVPGKPVHPLF